MKNAMKKLMAFVLVAVMLVSAVPTAFADTVDPAAAAAPTTFSVTISIDGPGSKDVSATNVTTVSGDTLNSLYTRVAQQNGIDITLYDATFTWTNAANGQTDTLGAGTGISGAGTLLVTLSVKQSHTHQWIDGSVITAATCTTAGSKNVSCVCGTTSVATIEALGHDWDDANCNTPMTCKVCDITYGDATGDHTWADATCTAPKTCTVCKATTGVALGHTYNVEDATCTVAKYCTRCQTQEEAKADHTPNIDAATCLQAKVCTVCQIQLEAALGHTPNADGKCTRCNETVGMKHAVYFYPNYNTNNTPEVKVVYEGAYVYGQYTPSRYGYTFGGWYYDSALTRKVESNTTVNSDLYLYAKWEQVAPKEVYVRVYSNGNTNNVYAIVDLYSYAQDGVITKADLESAIKNYGIKANNDAGLSVYGPFTPAQWNSYCLDDYYRNTTEKVTIDKNEKTVLYAMVHNVVINGGSSSSGTKADSTNPKTGDMIFAPMIVLGASASCLAVLYYLNKKRAI